MSAWLSAHDVFRTDWASADPQEKRMRDTTATIPCGLATKRVRKGGSLSDPCPELFFTEEGRDLHHEEEHHIASLAARLDGPTFEAGYPVGDMPKSKKRGRRMWYHAEVR